MPLPDQYFSAFSDYLVSGDTTALMPYLQAGSNPAYLAIYRNGAIKSGLDALASNFPTLKQLLGGDVFNSFAKDYVLSHWPQDGCLSNYGESLADYLRNNFVGFPNDCADFALLDRAWLDTLFAADEKPLTGQELAKMLENEPDQSPLIQVVKSMRIVTLASDCLSDWIELKFGTAVNAKLVNAKTVMLWRNGTSVQYRQLSDFEQKFIVAVAESGSVMKGAESALAIEPSGDISTLFAGLITAGILKKTDH